MSRDFELGFDAFDHSNHQDGNEDDNIPENYKVASSVRNLCLIWQDGRKKFFNYAYLVSADYVPEKGLIQLSFTTSNIILKGIRLNSLYDKLLFHIPIKITCTLERYNELTKEYCVNEIIES